MLSIIWYFPFPHSLTFSLFFCYLFNTQLPITIAEATFWSSSLHTEHIPSLHRGTPVSSVLAAADDRRLQCTDTAQSLVRSGVGHVVCCHNSSQSDADQASHQIHRELRAHVRPGWSCQETAPGLWSQTAARYEGMQIDRFDILSMDLHYNISYW